jgi:PAS domain S-box-containing protein
VPRIAVAVLHDIATLKQTRQSLAMEKERAQVTLSAITDGVITTDLDARILSVNPAAERLTGWSEADAKGRPIGEIFHTVDENTRIPAPNPVERCLDEGRAIRGAPRMVPISRHGKKFSVESSSAPIRLADDRVIGAVLVFHDVTESKQVGKSIWTVNWREPLSRSRERGARPGATRGLKRFPDYTKSRTPSKLRGEL